MKAPLFFFVKRKIGPNPTSHLQIKACQFHVWKAGFPKNKNLYSFQFKYPSKWQAICEITLGFTLGAWQARCDENTVRSKSYGTNHFKGLLQKLKFLRVQNKDNQPVSVLMGWRKAVPPWAVSAETGIDLIVRHKQEHVSYLLSHVSENASTCRFGGRQGALPWGFTPAPSLGLNGTNCDI